MGYDANTNSQLADYFAQIQIKIQIQIQIELKYKYKQSLLVASGHQGCKMFGK